MVFTNLATLLRAFSLRFAPRQLISRYFSQYKHTFNRMDIVIVPVLEDNYSYLREWLIHQHAVCDLTSTVFGVSV